MGEVRRTRKSETTVHTMTLLEIINTIVLAILTYATAPQDIQQNLREQVQPGMLVRMVAVEYSSWMLATAAHEYGHAALAEHITGEPAIIHLGTNNPKYLPWLSCGKFNLDGFNPKHGVTEYPLANQQVLQKKIQDYVLKQLQPGQTSSEDIKKLLTDDVIAMLTDQVSLTQDDHHKILLIGGLCGFIARFAMQAITTGNLQPDYIMIHELFNSLLPLAPGSDAYIIWKERFGLTDKQLNKILFITTFLDVSACVFCTIIDKRNTPNAPLHTRAMLGLINYYVSGYARFYAGSSPIPVA